MNTPDPELPQAYKETVSTIRQHQRNTIGPLVVAIDGRSGAGKSTLASHLTGALDAVCVPCDDFFAAAIPAAAWDARTAAQRAADALDWRRLLAEAIWPLRAGNPARWFAFDFTAGRRADGTYPRRAVASEREPRAVILLDGAYSARPELVEVLDFTILVEAPAPRRLERLAAREDPQFLEEWHACWDLAEEHYFTRVRPPSTFDMVLTMDGAG